MSEGAIVSGTATLRPRIGLPGVSDLTRLADRYGSDKGSHVHGYTAIMEGFLRGRRSSARKVLEIGVFRGASLKMWRDYFPAAIVVGVDTDPNTLATVVGEDRIETHMADQANRAELSRAVGAEPYDLIVDDGGHRMEQQQVSLGFLFQHVSPGGFYMIEDLHTSFDPRWGSTEGTSTADVVSALMAGTGVTSEHMTEAEREYLMARLDECWLFKGRGPFSLLAVLRKKRAE